MKCRTAPILALILFATSASAEVVEFNEDPVGWAEAVGGDFTTIDFLGFPHLTPVTDQYLDVGVLFTDENDIITGPDAILTECTFLDNYLRMDAVS